MSHYKYSYKDLKENMARAVARDITISRKSGIEISKYLRGRTTKRAKTILEQVIELKEPVPYTRFTNGLGHRKGHMASGRYPVKAAKEFLSLIKTAETNAQNKGLSSELIIIHLSTQKASQQFHYGRQRRRLMKRAHVEIVVEEKEGAKRPAKKKEVKKETPTEEKKAEEKTEKVAEVVEEKSESLEEKTGLKEDEKSQKEIKPQKKVNTKAKKEAKPKEVKIEKTENKLETITKKQEEKKQND